MKINPRDEVAQFPSPTPKPVILSEAHFSGVEN
jgi:hypothetical protein